MILRAFLIFFGLSNGLYSYKCFEKDLWRHLLENLLAMLPERLAALVHRLAAEQLNIVEEIRIRTNRPLEIAFREEVRFSNEVVTAEEAEQFLGKISQFSFYMLDEQLRRGYITVAGGHRIGLAGKVVLDAGQVKGLRGISSFNIRIAREQIGVAERLVPYLYKKNWLSTLIVGAPQTGKTTYLRDLARFISQGNLNHRIAAKKVGIVDERSEIAGCVNGIPQMTFGHRVDVLDACPKAEGMMMMIRSMSPDVLVVDEIGRAEDVQAIMEAVNAGIALIISVHGNDFNEILRRPSIKSIIENGNFKRIIELQRQKKPGVITNIYDEEGRRLRRPLS